MVDPPLVKINTEIVTTRSGFLPSFAGRLFDFLVEHPVEIRIDAWRRLERPTNTPLEQQIFAEKIAALDSAQGASKSGISSADLLVQVIAIAWSWVTAPASLTCFATCDLAVQRERVVESVEHLCAAARRS